MRNGEIGFLEKLAIEIISDHRGDYSDTAIVLPTQRSVLYFKNYFQKHAHRDLILPQVFTFENLVKTYSGLRILSPEEALMRLFVVSRSQLPQDSLAFSEFIQYGQLLLSDFDQIDKNLVPADQLFAQLDIRTSIDRWAEDALTQAADIEGSNLLGAYFTFWQHAEELYSAFKDDLLLKHEAYSGLAYRLFYDQLKIIANQFTFETIHFAGFNYLTVSEEGIMADMRAYRKVNFHWDADPYFVGNTQHEYNKYFSNYRNKFKFKPNDSGISKTNIPELSITECPTQVSQVKYAIDKIAALISTADYENDIKAKKDFMAIVLGDETLLPVLLESFPTHFEDKNGRQVDVTEIVNVSMGRSLRNAKFMQLIHSIFDWQFQSALEKNLFTYKLILPILRHSHLNIPPKKLHAFDMHIKKSNKSQISITEILAFFDKEKTLKVLFKAWKVNFEDVFDYFQELIKVILDNQKIGGDEGIFMMAFRRNLNQIKTLLTEFASYLDFKSFRRLFMQIMEGHTVPFSAEPLSAIQIMGLLETRAIDFKFVHILSCNEGVLPKGRSAGSLLPFESKLAYKMPTFIDQDASVSYVFYRLFHRAAQIDLYHHRSESGMKSAEPSRFITQIRYEMHDDLEWHFHEKQLQFPHVKKDQDNFKIKKKDEILDKIKSYLSDYEKNGENKGGLSPSYLNLYLRSPLDFFMRKVLNIKEAEELEENFGTLTFGLILHEVLELALTDFQNQEITSEIWHKIILKKDFEEMVNNAIKENAGDIDMKDGKNILYKDLAVHLIKRYFTFLSQSPNFTLLSVEQSLSYDINIVLPDGQNQIVRLMGKVDRIDFQEGRIRVLDYKTGAVPPNVSKIVLNSMDDVWTHKLRDKVIQLLVYKYLVIQAQKNDTLKLLPKNAEVETGFYFFRTSENLFVPLEIKEAPANNEIFLKEVELLIETIVQHMLNSEIEIENELDIDNLQSIHRH